MALVGAPLDDLRNLLDGEAKLVVGREVVRAQPDPGVGPEVVSSRWTAGNSGTRTVTFPRGARERAGNEIDDGFALAEHADRYRRRFNTIRPHEALAMRRPFDVHLKACNDNQTTKSNGSELLPL